MNLWSERCKALKKCPAGSLQSLRECVCVRARVDISVCVCEWVCDANEAGRAAVCPRLISVLRGAARMRVEVKWGVINLNEVQLFSHLLIIAG